MSNYSVTIAMCYEKFIFDIYTNHIFKANNDEEAMIIANTLEDNFQKYIQVYFNKNEKDIKVEIIKNDCFDKVYLEKFTYYDETKGEYLREVVNGYTLYPICNPKCFVKVNKDELIELLLRDCSVNLIDRDILAFDSIAYGVKNVDTDFDFNAIPCEAKYIEIRG